jgi:hypothetical protein
MSSGGVEVSEHDQRLHKEAEKRLKEVSFIHFEMPPPTASTHCYA